MSTTLKVKSPPTFDPDKYGKKIAPLLHRKKLMELGPGQPNEDLRIELRKCTIESIFPEQVIRDEDMARTCLAALWLYQDFLTEFHHLIQLVQTNTASFWHAIMHRREQDYWNSKFWFRSAGQHPIFPALQQKALELSRKGAGDPTAIFIRKQYEWDPFVFVDLCERNQGTQSSAELLCRQIQTAEWEILFDFCYDKVLGLK